MKSRNKWFLLIFLLITFLGLCLLKDRNGWPTRTISPTKKVFKENTQNESNRSNEKINNVSNNKEDNSQSNSNVSSNEVIYSSNNPLNNLKPLLDKYGYRIRQINNIEKIKLPTYFKTVENGIPVGIKLAMGNEVSKDIGLDFSTYLGREVTCYTIEISKNVDSPVENLVVLICDNKLIGCWKRISDFYIRSLSGKAFIETLNSSWESWIDKNDLNMYYGALSNSIFPEELIRRYFQYISGEKYESAFLLCSKLYQTISINENEDVQSLLVPNVKLSSSFFLYTTKVTVKDMNCVNSSEPKSLVTEIDGVPRDLYALKSYYVQTISTFSYNSFTEEKPYIYFIRTIKESENSPWKIDYIGTNLD